MRRLIFYILFLVAGTVNSQTIQPLDADTLSFYNETQFRDFLRYYGLKDYDIISASLTSDCSTQPSDLSTYPAEGSDDYLHEEIFEGKQCVYILDHIITRKLWTILLPTLGDPDADLCSVRIWITNLSTGQVVMFDDVFNWLDENGKNIFNLNKKMYFLYGFNAGQRQFKSSQIQLTTGYDFTFPDLYPETHDIIRLRFDGISMYTTSVFYADDDEDGYGDPNDSLKLFIAPPGYVNNHNDCNDANSNIHPGAAEFCNAADDDCDGLFDEGVTESITISAGGPVTFCQGGNVVLTANYSGTSVQWKRNGVNIPGATSASYTAAQKGNYTCTTSSTCGSALSGTITVNVNKLPAAGITAGGPTSFCPGGNVLLTETAVAGCTYQWYRGAALIPGAVSISYSASATGIYRCRVTKTATGCFKNSNSIAVSASCKESEKNITEEIIIYPNPATDAVHINGSILNQAERVTLKLYNSAGILVYADDMNVYASHSDIRISLHDLSSGMYELIINADGAIRTTHLIKQ